VIPGSVANPFEDPVLMNWYSMISFELSPDSSLALERLRWAWGFRHYSDNE
jgi:hypothetical protein